MDNMNQAQQKRYVYKRMSSPVGRLMLVATDDGLAAILWENDRPRRVRLQIEAEQNQHPVLVEAERQLEEYFAGQRMRFALNLDLSGTAFQRKVWDALLTIPLGRRDRMQKSRGKSGLPALPARSVRPMAEIRFRSWRRVIASSGPPAHSRASPAASMSRHNC